MAQQFHSWADTWRKLIWRDPCIPLFMCSSTIYNSRDVDTSECPSAGERIKVWRVYTVQYCSSTEQWRQAACSSADGLGTITLSETSQKEKAEHYMIAPISGIQTMTPGNLSTEPKPNSQAQRIDCHRGRGGERWTRRLGSVDVNCYLQGG